MLDSNQIFILKGVTRDFFKDGVKVENSVGGNYSVFTPDGKEAKIKIPGELLIDNSKILRAVVFKDLEITPYATDHREIKYSGVATNVLVVCDDVLGLIRANMSQEKAHNLKIKASE